MATDGRCTPGRISPEELDAVLTQARVEQWEDLALRGPDDIEPHRADSKPHRFYLREPIGVRLFQVLELVRLTSLDVSEIGDDGARALAPLTELTSLNVSGNAIGDDGAHALAAFPRLTHLDLNGNRIGNHGARALLDAWSDAPRLPSLRTLDLRANRDIESVLPPESVPSADAQAILAAYRNDQDANR
jgi:hypothetical protein